MTAQLNWYAAYTANNFEKKIQKEISSRNVECYLPLQKVYRQWSDRVKKIEVPLFKNYVFIRTQDHSRRNLVDINGLVRFVGSENRANIVNDRDIETIRRIEDQTLETEEDLIEGDLVRIIRGPLAGLEGRLSAQRGSRRFVIRIEAIRQSVSFEVPTSNLEKIHLR